MAIPPAQESFRIGVVGHRPNRLGNGDPVRLAATLSEILTGVRHQAALFAPSGAPVAVSALAEGADRLFAEQALALGYRLNAVLPFAEAEYRRDFQPSSALEADSLGKFSRLLRRASTVTELDGNPRDRRSAYLACGRWILDASDLLVAVWDGYRLGQPAGTEAILDRALAKAVPAVWVDAALPHSWEIFERSQLPAKDRMTPSPDPDALAQLRAIVADARPSDNSHPG